MKAVKIINLIVASIFLILNLLLSDSSIEEDYLPVLLIFNLVYLGFSIVFVAERTKKKEQTPAKNENDVIERLTKENQLLRENNELIKNK